MIVVGWILFAFGSVRLIVALLNRAGRHYLPPPGADQAQPAAVSVLIPARNEERNIHRLLDDLAAEGEEIGEILVYDDQSTDRTAEAVERRSRNNPKIRLIAGAALPDGWLGKNHACHTLASQAAGSYLLFLDADVRIRGRAVLRAVQYMQRTGIELLSVFPHQLMPDRGTRSAVPLMNWILLTLLPLAAVRRAPQPSLCAANGQFMLFRAATYRQMQPHLKYRMSPVEDMDIARHYKESGCPVDVLLGRGEIECTMYGSLHEAIEGFSKNFFRFFGGNEWLCYAFAIATTAAPPVIFLFSGVIPGIVYLACLPLIRSLVSSASMQSVRSNILRMVVQQAVLWIIIVKASAGKRKKEVIWKGRNIFPENHS